MKLRTDQRNYVIAALCAILIVMGVGYAAFSSLLTINGTANISNSWCVGFDQTKTNTYQITKGVSTGTEPTGEMTYSGTACETNYVPNARLASVFYQPGDQIVYTLTIKNASSVGAAIKSIKVDNENVTSNKTVTKENITYIVEMPETTTLAAGAETTMKVTAKFQNETDVTGPYSGETKTIEVGINVEEDDGNGGFDVTPVSTTYTGPIYRWSSTHVYNGDSIATESGTKWCLVDDNSDTCWDHFDTQAECETALAGFGLPAGYSCQQKTGTFGGVGEYTTDASTLNKTYYLKHDVEEDIITASYVCFVYNNAEHCMKGEDGGESFAANTQTIKDYQAFYNLNTVSMPDANNPGCNFSSSRSYCYGGGFYNVYAESSGYVYVDGSSSERCFVPYDGYSICYP